jgi:Porin subfamily/DcaP outer membrane protein
MRKVHRIRSIAVSGAVIAIVSYLTGVAAASADELADLRATQEELQRRIDQLAQATLPPSASGTTGGVEYGGAPAAGAPTLGGSFPRSFLIPGTQTSIRVGGFTDNTFVYWFQGAQVNGTQITNTGANGQAQSAPLNVHANSIVPGLLTPGELIPVQGEASRANGIFNGSSLESRLFVETRTPTEWGEARTYVQFDFAGCESDSCNGIQHVANPLVPRLLYAYGTLGNFLAGQANSNFSDPDAGGETIDFGGDVGQTGVVRIPQVRYTQPGPWGSAWSASLELPETDALTPAGQVLTDTTLPVANSLPGPGNTTVVVPCQGVTTTGLGVSPNCTLAGNPTLSPAPDFTLVSYWSEPWGHVDFKFVGRALEINDGHLIARRFFGYGGGISGDTKPGWFGWSKDDIQWQVTAGNGIGRYLNESDNAGLVTNWLAPPTTAAQAAEVRIETVPAIGISGGYQHWWLANLRSNATFGYAYYNYNSTIIGPVESLNANKQLVTAHANLIWTPVAFIDTGVEFVWAQRLVVAGLYGKEEALLANFRVKF